jgi:hypothetical protein
MFISLNNEYITMDFNPYPRLKVRGPEELYHVELREYPNGEDVSRVVDAYRIAAGKNKIWREEFLVPIEFYMDFEISVSKFHPYYGMRKIFTHRYNDYSKLVRFNLHTENREELEIWLDRIRLYQEVHGCEIFIDSRFDDVNKKFSTYYRTYEIDFYKTYNISRYPKASTDFRTMDMRMEGYIWFGNFKKFWSYQHPRNWNNLSSQQIIDDILGL